MNMKKTTTSQTNPKTTALETLFSPVLQNYTNINSVPVEAPIGTELDYDLQGLFDLSGFCQPSLFESSLVEASYGTLANITNDLIDVSPTLSEAFIPSPQATSTDMDSGQVLFQRSDSTSSFFQNKKRKSDPALSLDELLREKEIRKQKNTESARRSRARRKLEFDELQGKYESALAEIRELKAENAKLELRLSKYESSK
jgi:hypothetical protein